MTYTDLGLTPERIGVIGDIHGNTSALTKALWSLKNKEINTVVQVGDFGFWGLETNFMKEISEFCEMNDMKVLFIDGNHEQHEILNSQKVDEDGVRRLTDNIWHLPRGFSWQWNNTVFLAMGGAFSIDYRARTIGIDWFPEEMISIGEAMRVIENLKSKNIKVDVMFTHDFPSETFFPIDNSLLDTELVNYSESQRELIGAIVDVAMPEILYHGHHHIRNTSIRNLPDGNVTVVEGLGRDTQPLNDYVVIHEII